MHGLQNYLHIPRMHIIQWFKTAYIECDCLKTFLDNVSSPFIYLSFISMFIQSWTADGGELMSCAGSVLLLVSWLKSPFSSTDRATQCTSFTQSTARQNTVILHIFLNKQKHKDSNQRKSNITGSFILFLHFINQFTCPQSSAFHWMGYIE